MIYFIENTTFVALQPVSGSQFDLILLSSAGLFGAELQRLLELLPLYHHLRHLSTASSTVDEYNQVGRLLILAFERTVVARLLPYPDHFHCHFDRYQLQRCPVAVLEKMIYLMSHIDESYHEYFCLEWQ